MAADPGQGNVRKDADEYRVSEEAPKAKPSPAAPSKGPAGGATWYLARATGQREGPMTLELLKQCLASGSVTEDSLVWREGMPAWAPARSLPELFGARPGKTPPSLPEAPTQNWAENLKTLDPMLSSPSFFRIAARISAALSVLLIAGSLLLGYWGVRFYIEAAVLALVFLVGEAAGTMIERLDRIESSFSAREERSSSKTFR